MNAGRGIFFYKGKRVSDSEGRVLTALETGGDFGLARKRL